MAKINQQQMYIAAVVLLKESSPPLFWKMSRIRETHPGSDGVVPVVIVKTVSDVFRRVVTKLVLLIKESVSE